MAAVKFSKQHIQPNPLETNYWVDLSEDRFGGVIKYYNGDNWSHLNCNGNGSGGGITSVSPLTIRNSDGTVQLVFNGNEPKELVLTKDLIGLSNVNNTKDSDKTVKYASTSEQSNKLVNSITFVDHQDNELMTFNGESSKKLMLTKDIVGLNNVDNTADKDKTVKHASTSDTAYQVVNTKGRNIAGSIIAGTTYTNYLGNRTDDTYIYGTEFSFWTASAGGGFDIQRMKIHANGDVTATALRLGEKTEEIDQPRTTLDVLGEIWTTQGVQINGTKISKQESGALEIDNDLVVTNDTLKISIAALYAKVTELEQEIAKLKQ